MALNRELVGSLGRVMDDLQGHGVGERDRLRVMMWLGEKLGTEATMLLVGYRNGKPWKLKIKGDMTVEKVR